MTELQCFLNDTVTHTVNNEPIKRERTVWPLLTEELRCWEELIIQGACSDTVQGNEWPVVWNKYGISEIQKMLPVIHKLLFKKVQETSWWTHPIFHMVSMVISELPHIVRIALLGNKYTGRFYTLSLWEPYCKNWFNLSASNIEWVI